jgi:hypothetical protein
MAQILCLLMTSPKADVKSNTGMISFIPNKTSEQVVMRATLNQVTMGSPEYPIDFHLHGRHMLGFQTVSSNLTLGGNSIIFANTANHDLDLALPYAGNVVGATYRIKKTSHLNKLRLITGGELMDTYIQLEVPASQRKLETLELMSDGQQWHILSMPDGMMGSDPPSYSPLQDSPALWYDGSNSSSFTLQSGNISQWNDLSGHDRHATQSSTHQQPLYLSGNGAYFGGIQAMTAVNFNPTDNHNSPETIVMMISAGSYGANVIFRRGAHNSGYLDDTFEVASSKLKYRSNYYGSEEDAQLTTSSNVSDGMMVIYASGNTGAQYIRNLAINGSSLLSQTYNSPPRKNSSTIAPIGNYLNIGHDMTSGAVEQKWAHDITLHELIIFNETLSESKRQMVEGYLAHKWLKTDKLPSDHPYKNGKPLAQ